MRHLDVNAAASIADIEQALEKAGHELQPGNVVLIHTGNDTHWGHRDYFNRGPGVSAEATHWLIDHGIKLMGIDAWGWDSPLVDQARQAKNSDRAGVFWAAHYVGIEKEYCQIERLANLAAVPSSGFTICAFPLKVKRGSAGPARVVALVNQ